MAQHSPAPSGGGANNANNLQLSAPERLAFAHYFSLADPTNSGIVQGAAAVPFFAKARLSPPVLGQIWSIADSANNGFLTAPTFSVALRLIGHAQRGETPDESLINKPGPPPTLEGIQIPNLAAVTPLSPQRTGSTQVPAVEIKPEDRARYTRIFATAGPVGGLLEGEKAKEIFVKSKLPFDKLGAIWNLADTQSRGALDLTDFIIGMHYIQGSMSGTITSIPVSLPQGLYVAATGGSTLPLASPLRAQITGSSAIPRQLTGQQWSGGTSGITSATLSPSHTGLRGMPVNSPSLTTGSLGAQRTGGAFGGAFGAPANDWGVTAEEKAKADRFFDGLDTDKKGILDGQTVVPFFMQSKLNEQTLANIWDLSDITQTGSLSRDEFAVAMHLINAALTGTEVPQELPANLVPPGLRGQRLPEAVNPQQSDTQKDLFSLMDDDDDPTSLPISTASAFAPPAAGVPLATGVSAPPPRPAVTSPFDDDVFFSGAGQNNRVASPSAVGAQSTPQPSAQPPKDQSAELGNKTLQLKSTERAVDDLKARRSTLESNVTQGAASLAEIESRLSSVRVTHEAETRVVKELEGRKEKQAAELKSLQEELISNESELSRLKAEKDEVEQQVMHDREEIRSTKKRMSEVQAEVTALKTEVEKLKKDARQQKGLLAISKKQLSSAEAEKGKLVSEKQEHLAAVEQAERDAPTPSVSHIDADEAVPREVPAIPGGFDTIKSPAASVRSNNPFDRFNTTSPGPAHGNSVSSPSLSAASFAGGAEAGAAGAAAGMGAMHLSGSDHATSHQIASTESRSVPTQEDPWAASVSSPAATQSAFPAQQSQQVAFDDAFGDDFEPSATSAPQPTDQASTAFDDAFGNFDNAPTDVSNAPAAVKPADSEIAADAPAVDEETSDPDIPGLTAVEKGKAPARDSDTDDTISSGDEDEGPEDVEGDGRGYRGYTSSPYDRATESSTTTDGSVPSVDQVGAIPAIGVPSADPTARVEERFPELPSDAELERQIATSESAGVGQDLNSSTSSADLAAPSSSNVTSTSTTGYAPDPVTSQDTGASDAFVDAPTDDSASNIAEATPSTGIPASTSRPTLTSMTDSTRSLAGSTIPDTSSDTRPVSPTSTMKTRRAAPPPPVRSTSGSTTTASISANTLGGGTVTTLPATGNTPFDDFEASFADLGPIKDVGTGSQLTTGGAPPSSVNDGGFADAFDDDADFDFVPSFGNSGQPATDAVGPAGGATTATSTGPTNLTEDAFAGFDDAFGNLEPQSSTRSAVPTGGNNSNSGGTDSSAFSFEDAFAPPTAAASGDVGASTVQAGGDGGMSSYFSPSAAGSSAAPPASSAATTDPAAPAPVAAAAATSTNLAVPTTTTNNDNNNNSTPNAPPRASPALADDAGPVRQLAGMGFPRHKVIAALEKSNYRVEKALERLLAES